MTSGEDCVKPITLFYLYVRTTEQKLIALFPHIFSYNLPQMKILSFTLWAKYMYS